MGVTGARRVWSARATEPGDDMRLKGIGGAAGLLTCAALGLAACGGDRSVQAYCESVEEADEIQADVEDYEAAFDDLADALQDVDSPEALEQELAGFQERFAGTGEASMRIAAFTDENCEEGE
jgi:hypothetical protein